MKKILVLSLALCAAFAVLLFRPAQSYARSYAATYFGNDWRPVTPEDMSLTADQISKNADAAILFSETYIDDSDISGTGFSEYIRIKVFTDRGIEEASTRNIIYDNSERIKDIKARTIKPDGTIVELKKEDVFDKSLLKISRGEVREKTFKFPGVTPGCIIEYRYRRQSDDVPRFRIDLQQDFFAREVKIYVKPFQSNESAGMQWITFNLKQGQKIEAPKKEGAWIVIKAINLDGLREEPYMPASRTRKLWGMLWYTRNESVNPDKYWASIGQGAVGDALRDYVGHNKEIKKAVATIVGPSDDAVTKERKLAEFVQREIHNTSIEENAPVGKQKDVHNVDDVFKAKRGDPDDINFVYISMLQAAGLDARIAFAYSRARDVFRPQLTERFQLFEMDVIAAVRSSDGKYTFLDPGTAFAPFGYVSWDKQWVSAIVIDKKQTEFVDVPFAPSKVNATIRSATVTLDSSGDVVGKGEVQYTGSEGISMKRNLNEKSPENQPAEWRSHFGENIPNFTSKDEKIENVSDSEKPLTAQFDLRIATYASKTGKRLLLQPALFTHGQKALFPSADRVQDIDFRYPYSEKDHVEFTLPDGYTVEEVPQPIVIDAKAVVYKQSFKVQGNKLIVDRELNVELILVPVTSYGALKNVFDEVYKADQFTISLKQASSNQ